MDKDKQIWEYNLEIAQEIDDILANKYLYSHDALCCILNNIKMFMRESGHQLERYDRYIQIHKDILFKLP